MSIYYLDTSALIKHTAGLSQLTFLSADDNLLAIANAEGLFTDNPNLHP
jgi:hypothetical protein